MSNKKTDEQTQQSPELVQLLTNGNVTLTAKTREELQAKAEAVADEAGDKIVAVGAVGQDRETGDFTLRLDILNN